MCLEFDDPDVSVRVTDDGGTAKVPAPFALSPTASGAVTGAGNRNGNGSAARTTNGSGGGHGVTGMAERATAFGGSLEAGPGAAGGWEVRAVLHGCKAAAPA